MSIPSTTWRPSRSIPPRSSRTPAIGCPGITRPAYPSTIPDEADPPNILNHTLPAVLQPGDMREPLLPSLAHGKFFSATQAYRKLTFVLSHNSQNPSITDLRKKDILG